MEKQAYQVFPVTPDRWNDLEILFGKKGATAGCWCMYWRLPRSEYDALKGEGNRAMLKSLVDDGEEPGLLAYDGEIPVGWTALAPRADYDTLSRSRVLKPVDEQPVWSIPCFFVARAYRRKGVTLHLLEAAKTYARQHGAKILEGYPIDPGEKDQPDVFVFTGLVNAFKKAGFTEVARRSPTRPVMRIDL